MRHIWINLLVHIGPSLKKSLYNPDNLIFLSHYNFLIFPDILPILYRFFLVIGLISFLCQILVRQKKLINFVVKFFKFDYESFFDVTAAAEHAFIDVEEKVALLFHCCVRIFLVHRLL